FFALPHASRKLEREHVQDDEADAESEERPPLAELRRDETEAGEDRRGKRDDKSGELLRGAAGFHARRDDHRDAAGRDEVEERQDDQRIQQLEREDVRDARGTVAVGGERISRGERHDARDHHRHDHPHELAQHDVEVTDRRRGEGDERPVLLLGCERRGDHRHAGEGGEEHAWQRETDEGHVACRARRDPAVREDEEERDHDEDPGTEERGAVEEDLPADLAPRDEPPLHRRASARMLRYASSSERSSADNVMTRTPVSRSARSAAGLTEAGSSAAKRSAKSPSRALASSA